MIEIWEKLFSWAPVEGTQWGAVFLALLINICPQLPPRFVNWIFTWSEMEYSHRYGNGECYVFIKCIVSRNDYFCHGDYRRTTKRKWIFPQTISIKITIAFKSPVRTKFYIIAENIPLVSAYIIEHFLIEGYWEVCNWYYKVTIQRCIGFIANE